VAEPQRIVILGAGSIGGFVGGCWQAAGLDVRFIGRPSFRDDIARKGMTLTDERGWRHVLPADDVEYSTGPDALAEADLVALAVKSGATAEAARTIAARQSGVGMQWFSGASRLGHRVETETAARMLARAVLADSTGTSGTSGQFHWQVKRDTTGARQLWMPR